MHKTKKANPFGILFFLNQSVAHFSSLLTRAYTAYEVRYHDRVTHLQALDMHNKRTNAKLLKPAEVAVNEVQCGRLIASNHLVLSINLFKNKGEDQIQ